MGLKKTFKIMQSESAKLQKDQLENFTQMHQTATQLSTGGGLTQYQVLILLLIIVRPRW
jgi:hypothetical protein